MPEGTADSIRTAYQLAERAIDRQASALAAEHDKLDKMVRLGLAIIAGMIAAVSLMVDGRAAADDFVAVMLGGGFVFVCVGIVGLFVASLAGGGEAGAQHGIDAKTVQRLLVLHDHHAAHLQASALEAMASAHPHNQALVDGMVRARALAGFWIGLGVLAHLVSIAYIARGFFNA